MSGVTKRIFERELIDINIMWNKQIKTIKHILPQNYTVDDIIYLIKRFFPHEWYSVQAKYEYYSSKDKYLKRIKGKSRYNMDSPEDLIKKSSSIKQLLSINVKKNYFENFDDDYVYREFIKLEKIRRPKILKITNKIEKAKIKTQQMTPVFLDKLIGLYERKNTSQSDRMHILFELKKYYNSKIIQFFFKLNDTELNIQLRKEAFFHLQSFNYQPRLRKQKYMQVHTKNKNRKEYAFQTCNIPLNPSELEYRINNSAEQEIKFYDYFISHSSNDGKMVQKLISYLNSKGINVYCDWISDSDYLKRKLVCQATLNVIKSRLDISNAILFVNSKNSLESIWCKYELNYFLGLNKPMKEINIESVIKGNYDIHDLNDEWYIDADYKKYKLI